MDHNREQMTVRGLSDNHNICADQPLTLICGLRKSGGACISRLKGDLRTTRCESAVAMRVYDLFSNKAFLSHFEKFTSIRKNQSPAFLQITNKTVTRGNLASGIYVAASLAAKAG